MNSFHNIPSFYEQFKQYFNTGSAVPLSIIKNQDFETDLLKTHFNLVTAENCTKMAHVYKGENNYFWDNADLFINFAKANNMKTRWHTFIWHNQTPEWIFNDGSETVSREKIQKRVKAYIQAVADRYKDKISSYDVVNEVISDKNFNLRTNEDRSRWLEVFGDDYIEKAFCWAHEAAPDAELVINDYNLESNVQKRDAMYDLVKKMKNRNIPVNTVGLQMHVSIDYPSIRQIEDSFEKFASLGVNVAVTEMDVSIYSFKEKEEKEITQEILSRQADYYACLFECFKQQAKKGILKDVIFWGISDRNSWKNNFPVADRKDAPLLFDYEGKPKPAFYRLIGQNKI